MFRILHLATGVQVNYKDEPETTNGYGSEGYDPNAPRVKPKLYFKSRLSAAIFIESNSFVLAEDSIPLIADKQRVYHNDYLIPKYQLEIEEI